MKLRITLKDPDGVSGSLYDHAEQSVMGIDGLSSEEIRNLMNSRMEEARNLLKRWVEYDEYVRVEIDTETGETRVIPVD